MPSNWPFTFRLVTFATTILLSFIVLSVSADLVSMNVPVYDKFSAFALATSLLTLLIVTPMLIIDNLRQGSILSYAGVEIASLTFLWIFWLTSGSYAAWTDNQIVQLYSYASFGLSQFVFDEATCQFSSVIAGGEFSRVKRFCHEIKAVIAFSFILWFLLMAYTFTLLVLALRASANGRGYSAWTTSVHDGGLLRPATESAIQMPVAQTQIISTPYVPAPPMTTVPQPFFQEPATQAPSYPSPTQRSLSMSVSRSIPQV